MKKAMMQERFILKYLLFIVITIINNCLADNTKLRDVLRMNSSRRSNNSNNYNTDEDVLQTEVTKILSECTSNNNKNKDDKNRYLENGDSSDTYRRISNNGNYYKNVGYGNNDNDNDGYNNYNSRNNPNSNRNYGSSYNDYNNNPYSSNARSNYSSSNGANSGSDFDYSSSNNPYSSNNNNGRYGFDNDNNRNRNYNDYGSSRLNNMQSNRYNFDRNNNGQGYTNNYENAGSDNMDDGNVRSYQAEAIYGNNREYFNSNKRGYNDGRNGDTYSYRRKRSKNNNDNQRISDNQCTSQCIFNSMELIAKKLLEPCGLHKYDKENIKKNSLKERERIILDDDEIPSETLMIKWIQEHINDDDMKRIKSLREIRKCFTRLSTSDIDDGCEYSNQLAKCLNLNID